MSARDTILRQIRTALAQSATPLNEAAPNQSTRQQESGVVPAQAELVTRFTQRATALASTVLGPLSQELIPSTVAAYLQEHRLAQKAVCWPALNTLDWAAAGIAIETRGASGSDLVGITGSFCAIADTGSLMLLSGPETPATVSLLPETHIAVVPVARVLARMEDAWALVQSEHTSLPRAVNFVSGPSRTADIEQTVTLGAHGPYRVLIVLVENG